MPQIIVGFVLVMLFFSYWLQIISLPKIHPGIFYSLCYVLAFER